MSEVRRRIRDAGEIEAFSRRLRMATAYVGASQTHLAQLWGGFGLQGINRLFLGRSQTLPIDLAVNISRWALEMGFRIEWLWCGIGPMRAINGQDNG